MQITYRGDPVYNFYPMDKIPPTQDIRLKDSSGGAAAFARGRTSTAGYVLRSAAAFGDETSRFPIMQRIDEHRKRLIEQRRWTDRNDQVDAATVEMDALPRLRSGPAARRRRPRIAARSRFGSVGSVGCGSARLFARSFSRAFDRPDCLTRRPGRPGYHKTTECKEGERRITFHLCVIFAAGYG